jgi:hypothetical protein
MATKTIKKEINLLAKEIKSLRLLLFSIISDKDSEGEYREGFVKSVLKAEKEKPEFVFTTGKDFLKLLRQ